MGRPGKAAAFEDCLNDGAVSGHFFLGVGYRLAIRAGLYPLDHDLPRCGEAARRPVP